MKQLSLKILFCVSTLGLFSCGQKKDAVCVEAVDLGLSVKWASCNVGADSPEDYGGYYAWGETKEKDYYGWETYKWCKGNDYSMTKYCEDSHAGTIDNKTTLAPKDDVAHVKWGDGWRMPTMAELEELRTECVWNWTIRNSVFGYQVTGPNGNSIFLPAAGVHNDMGVCALPHGGYYWSATLYMMDSGCAYSFSFHGYERYRSNGAGRSDGCTVRPVKE